MKRIASSSSFKSCTRAINVVLSAVLAVLSVISSQAQAQTFTTLHTFGLSPDGAQPWAGLIRDALGNLYGTTYYGGTYDLGTVFKIDPSGHAATLHSFSGTPTDGRYLVGSVINDDLGNLYGVASGGGPCCGMIFELDPSGKETVLHNFYYPDRGQNPFAGLVRDAEGNLYGTAAIGLFGWGVDFKLAKDGEFRVLHNFDGEDGAESLGSLIHDAAGNLYGTSSMGGLFSCGTVFKLDENGKGGVLHDFGCGPDGDSPRSRLIVDPYGNLYGTTTLGGAYGYGTVFKIDSSGVETVLYSFKGNADGLYPYGGLALDSTGNLYGTTAGDGYASHGTVFRLTTAGRLTVLHTFKGKSDGNEPVGDLIRDAAGNLYGTTLGGGTFNFGTVFEVSP